jgi:1,4-alpha-glucan branching enzyme
MAACRCVVTRMLRLSLMGSASHRLCFFEGWIPDSRHALFIVLSNSWQGIAMHAAGGQFTGNMQ